MWRSTVGLVVAVALAATPVEAGAAPQLEVTGGDQAQDCPDSAELLRLASQAQLSELSPVTHAYRVSFERTANGYRAEIVDETAQRTRRLEDVGAECAPLGRAVAVTLVMMWGTEQHEEPPAVLELVLPTPASPLPRTPPSRWVVGTGAAEAVGIVRTTAPAIVVDSSFEHTHFSWALGALWIPLQRLDLGPGAIDVQLLAGSARGCAFAFEPTYLGICARALAGSLLARSNGYDTDGQQTRPWFAVGLEAFVDGQFPFSYLRYRAAAGALVPLRSEAFSIQTFGPAYQPPPIGGLFTLALELEPF
jgi:hypothetical protein